MDAAPQIMPVRPPRDYVPFAVVRIIVAVLGILLTLNYVYFLWQSGISMTLANKDFTNYWMAAHLAASHQVADVFGSPPPFMVHLQAAFGPEIARHNWSYPPHYLLLMMPLALVGFKVGIASFLLLSGAFFIYALYRYTGARDGFPLLVAAAAMIMNAWLAQNGYLTAGLAMLCLHYRQTRPCVSGICLGLLTVKPQLVFLFPLLMLMERNWRVLFSAGLTTGGLVVLSIWAFGLQSWHDYVMIVMPYQAHLTATMGGNFITVLPSLYGAGRLYGLSAHSAMIVHLVAALPVFALLIWAFARMKSAELRGAVLLVGTIILTPYSLMYDMGFLAAALLKLIAIQDRWLMRAQIFFAVAALLPILMLIIGHMGFAIAPFILYPLFAMLLVRGGVWEEIIAFTQKSNRQTA